jgi:putative membrane protein
MMVRDHEAINDSLKKVAAKKGIALPAGIDAQHQHFVDTLAALAGSDFDDAYIADITRDHQLDAAQFKRESAETKDPDLKRYVDKFIPVMDEHLNRIAVLKK